MNVKIYKCFIASPGDTIEERKVCDDVFNEINKTLGEQLHFRIESKKWEDDARPSFGEDGQAVITEQLLNDYQLFIGIMWNKFGTPTKRAESGTEEEFTHAYTKYLEQGDIEIMFYFNNEPTKTNNLDLEQLKKVRGFKEKITELGGLYSPYEGHIDFEKKLKRHLNDYFVQHLCSDSSNPIIRDSSEKIKEIALRESVLLSFNNRLNSALSLFSNQPIVWADPVLSKTNEISQNADDNYDAKINLSDFIDNPKSTIIKSPPQFGLTSLACYMVKEAWINDSLWLYLDARKIGRSSVEKVVKRELKALNLENKNISCIILDSWICTEHGAKKLLKNLCASFRETPIIVMQTIDDSVFCDEQSSEEISREFNVLHLLALPRNQIRKVVSAYNDKMNIGEENIVLNKTLKDLDVLNIHRTPQNCLTLLKVSEKHFDESPVNRTKMLEMVLFVLFDFGELPTYKSKPDLKDCEHILGRFCESLIISNNYEFSRESFLKELEGYCKEKLIFLEVEVVFDILYSNHIIVKRNNGFIFRASYWVYYFAAQRMHSSKEFYNYILQHKKYVTFPEIIEFFTGIDRNRSDILEFLTDDIKETCDIAEDKMGMSDELNPFRFLRWKPTEENITKMKNEISDEVQKSKLPESLKDKFADQNYNQLRPYDQSIQDILQEYSLVILMRKIRACSKALRNSDYADPDIKRNLLKEITRGWGQMSKILLALTPMLATEGIARFEGAGFYLKGDFGSTVHEKMIRIFQVNPSNVVNMFKDDLYSNKIGPLIYDNLSSEKSNLIKHQLILFLIFERPAGWKKHVELYISSVAKDSYYLCDTVNCLRTSYRYHFATDKELNDIVFLLKMGYAKHEFGVKKPGLVNIKKISNKVIPKREV